MFCTKCRCLLSHLNVLQAMVEKTYNSLVNISLNMHGARAVQAKQQGSSGSLRGQVRNLRGQHRKACRILMKCGKTRRGYPHRDFFHMVPSVTGVSWSFSGCKWTIKDCGAMEFYVLLDLPHVRMCQKLIDVVRLVPTCMRRLVVELAWFGTVEGLANDDASRKPLQGWNPFKAGLGWVIWRSGWGVLCHGEPSDPPNRQKHPVLFAPGRFGPGGGPFDQGQIQNW